MTDRVQNTTLKLTKPADIPTRPMGVGHLPETLGALLGSMDICKQFIKQAYTDSQEYWECQRRLAALERRFAEAEAVWKKYNEDRR